MSWAAFVPLLAAWAALTWHLRPSNAEAARYVGPTPYTPLQLVVRRFALSAREVLHAFGTTLIPAMRNATAAMRELQETLARQNMLEKLGICPDCRGSGLYRTYPTVKCPTCGGNGRVPVGGFATLDAELDRLTRKEPDA